MAFKLLGAGSDLNTIVSDVNQNILELKNNEVHTYFKDDQGTRVVMLDKNGLKTTQPGGGIDVFTADDNEFTFNSNQNVFKIARTGSISLTQATIAGPGAGNYASDLGTLGTITHGLGYTPAVIAYLEFTSGSRALLPYQDFRAGSTSTAVWETYYVVVSSTALSVNYRRMVYGAGTSTFVPPISVKYYLLQETAN